MLRRGKSAGAASETHQIAAGLQNDHVLGCDFVYLVFGVEHGGESTWAIPISAVPEQRASGSMTSIFARTSSVISGRRQGVSSAGGDSNS
jgi:hypothetical protein